MTRPPIRAPWIAAALAAATLFIAAGCGSEQPADVARGKELFTQRCGACHILSDAGTRGVQGPNLDYAFQQSVADGVGRSTIEGVVANQIDTPLGKQMPADIVTGQDARSVAAYVASAVREPGARGGGGGQAPSGDGSSGTAEADDRNTVQIPADTGGQLAFQFEDARAEAGRVTLESKNDSSVPHNIALKDGPEGDVVQGGGTSRITADLEPGRHTFYCSVPGHEQAGMTGTLSVR